MNRPQSQREQIEGKAKAALMRGSGWFPLQPYPCHIEPPGEYYHRDILDPWECYYNNWHAPIVIDQLRDYFIADLPVVTGDTIHLDEAAYPNTANTSVISCQQFQDDEESIPKALQLLNSLPPSLTQPITFEVYAQGTQPTFDPDKFKTCLKTNQPLDNAIIAWSEPKTDIRFVCQKATATGLQRLLQSLHPNSAFVQTDDWLDTTLDVPDNNRARRATLALETAYVFPIRTLTYLDPDPLQSLLASLDHLDKRQTAVLQIQFCPATNPWQETLPTICRNPYKGPDYIFTDFSDRIFQTKFSSRLFAVTIQIAAPNQALFNQLTGFAAQYTHDGQRLTINTSDYHHGSITDYEHQTLRNCITDRYTHRPGLLLSAQELASLVHLPGPTTAADNYVRITVRTKPTPAIARTNKGLLLGINHHQGQQVPVRIPDPLRHMHTAIFGATRTGKTTLILHLALTDILRGHGVAVIEPHGDLIDDILARIPKHRVKDVILFDPADTNWPLPLNPLYTGRGSELEQERVRSDNIEAIKKKNESSWGPRLEHLLNMILATLAARPKSTFRDIRRLLLDETFRTEVMSQLKNPDLQMFWTQEFPTVPPSAWDPLNNKISPFLLSTTISNIICQDKCLDFDHILSQKKILLAKLSVGQLGETNATLLGSTLVTQLMNAAFRRASIPKNHRSYFFAYIDEMQNFANVASGVGFERILSEAAKYHLFLTTANQYTSQLKKEVLAAINGNVGTTISFRLGSDDAKLLAKEFAGFNPDDLMALERGRALVRLGTRNQACTIHTFPPPKQPKDDFTKAIITNTRKTHARPKAEVEAERKATPPATTTPKPPSKPTPKKQPAPKKLPKVLPPPDLDDLVS